MRAMFDMGAARAAAMEPAAGAELAAIAGREPEERMLIGPVAAEAFIGAGLTALHAWGSALEAGQLGASARSRPRPRVRNVRAAEVAALVAGDVARWGPEAWVADAHATDPPSKSSSSGST